MVGTFVLNLTFFHSLLCCNHLFMPLKTLKHTDPPYIFLNLQLFLFFLRREMCCRGFPGGSAVKNLPANRGDTGQMGLIPVLGRSPGEGRATHSSVLAWKNPWTEQRIKPQSMRSQRAGHYMQAQCVTNNSVFNSVFVEIIIYFLFFSLLLIIQ